MCCNKAPLEIISLLQTLEALKCSKIGDASAKQPDRSTKFGCSENQVLQQRVYQHQLQTKGLLFWDLPLAVVLVLAATATTTSQVLLALTAVWSSPSSNPCLPQTQQQCFHLSNRRPASPAGISRCCGNICCPISCWWIHKHCEISGWLLCRL